MADSRKRRAGMPKMKVAVPDSGETSWDVEGVGGWSAVVAVVGFLIDVNTRR